MPKVGKKQFSYSKAGKKKAKAHAKKTGKKVISKKPSGQLRSLSQRAY